MAHLTIIRGLPGSGKSHLASLIKRAGASDFVVEADDYFINKNGVYCFNPSKLPETHSECFENCFLLLDEGWDVVVANTFVRAAHILPYVEIAQSKNHTVSLIHCQGPWTNTYGVPKYVIDRMHREWEDFTL